MDRAMGDAGRLPAGTGHHVAPAHQAGCRPLSAWLRGDRPPIVSPGRPSSLTSAPPASSPLQGPYLLPECKPQAQALTQVPGLSGLQARLRASFIRRVQSASGRSTCVSVVTAGHRAVLGWPFLSPLSHPEATCGPGSRSGARNLRQKPLCCKGQVPGRCHPDKGSV